MIAQAEQAGVAPEAGVEFLREADHDAAAGHRIDRAGEVRQVGNAAFLVHDQTFHHVEMLGARLEGERRWRGAVVAPVIHVDVEVAAAPAVLGEVGDAVALRATQPRHHTDFDVNGLGLRAAFEPAPRLIRIPADRQGKRYVPVDVEVPGLHPLEPPVESVVGVTPCIVGRPVATIGTAN